MTGYYKLYKTRSNVAVDRIKQLEADSVVLAGKMIDLREKLKSAKEAIDLMGDVVSERNKLRDSNDRMKDENSDLVVANNRLHIENGGLSEQLGSIEKQLYDQQCDNIRLSGAVGALERVTVAAMNGDK